MASFHEVIVMLKGEDDASGAVGKVVAALKALPRDKKFLFLHNLSQAQEAFKDLKQQIDQTPNLTTTEARAQTVQAEAAVRELIRLFDGIDGRRLTARMELEIKNARERLAFMLQRLQTWENEHTATLSAEVEGDVVREIDDMDKILNNVVGTFSRANRSGTSFGDSMEQVFTSIRRFVPLLAGFALLIGISLVSAFAAVGSSAVAAAGGVASFATTLLVSFGPAVVLMINLMNRLSQVMFAFTAAQNLTKAQFADSAKAAGAAGKAAGQAAQQELQAAARARAIRDARQSITTAERSYQEAVRAARKEVADAIKEQREAYEGLRDVRVDAARDIADAEERVKQAGADLADAVVKAHEAIADSAREARDAVFELRDAQLDLADAKDEVSDLEKEMAKLLSSMGAADPGAMLQKLTDVDLVGFNVEDFVLQAKLDSNPEEMEQLEDLTRRLERAKHDLEVANVKVGDSEEALTRKQQEAARLQREGIAGVDTYRDAVDKLRDSNLDLVRTQEEAGDKIAASQQKLAEATREANRLRSQTVDQNPRVIAAAEGVRDANEALATATERANAAAIDQGAAAAAPLSQLAAWQFEMGQLSDAEQAFVKRLIAGMEALKVIFAPGTDAIFGALSRGLDTAGRFVLNFRGQLNDLGKEWARQIDLFSQDIFGGSSGDNFLQFQDMIEDSQTFTRLLGRGFRDATDMAINFAHAGLGPTRSILKQITDSMSVMKERTDDQRKMEKITRSMAASLRIWLDLLGSVTAAFAEFVAIVKPFGDEFVKWITDAVNGFREWQRSEEGRKQIQAFFRDTLPFAKALIGVLVKMGIIFLQLFQFAAPFLTDMAKGFSFILDLFIAILKPLNKISPGIRSLLLTFIPFVGILGRVGFIGKVITATFGKIPKVFALMGSSIARVLTFISRLGEFGKIGGLITGSFSKIVSLFAAIGGLGGRLVSSIFSGIASAVGLVADLVEKIIGLVVSGFAAKTGVLLSVGVTMVTKLVEGFKAVGGLWIDAVRFVIGAWLTAAEAFYGTALTVGVTIFSKVVSGFRTVGTLWLEAAKHVFEALFNAARIYYTAAFNIGKDILGKIVSGVRTVGSIFVGVVAHVFGALFNAVSAVFPQAVKVGGDVLDKIVEGLGTIGEVFAPVARKIVGGIRNALGALWEGANGVVDIGVNLIKGIAKGAIEGIPDFAKSLGKKIVGGIGDALGIGSPAKKMIPLGRDSAEGFALGLRNVIAASQAAFSSLPQEIDVPKISGADVDTGGIATGLADGLQKNLPQFADMGSEIVSALGEGVQSDQAALVESAKWFDETLASLVGDKAEGFAATGLFALAQVTLGLRTLIPPLADWGRWLVAQLTTAVTAVRSQLHAVGVGVTAVVTQGMRDGTLVGLFSFAAALWEQTKAKVEAQDFKSVGTGAAEQIKAGMLHAVNEPSDVDAFAKRLVLSVEERFGIASPSRVFMGIGENLTEGLIIGLAKKNPAGIVKSQFGGMARFARGLVLHAPDWLPGSGISSFPNMAKLGLELWDRGDMKLGSIPDRLFEEIFNMPKSVVEKYFDKDTPMDLAAIGLAVGKSMNATTSELIAAIAAGLAESGLRNLTGGDRDSAGVLQQRHSVKAWGTLKQIMNPFHAFQMFFRRIIQNRPHSGDPANMAQKVQASAFSDGSNYRVQLARAVDILQNLGVDIKRNYETYKGKPGAGDFSTPGGAHGFLGPDDPWARSSRATNFLQQWVAPLARELGLTLTDFWRNSGKASFHNVGRAMDWSNAGDQGSPQMLEFFWKAVKRWGKMLRELIYTHAGKSISNGQLVAPYSTALHKNHVHIALAQGGLVSGPVAALVGEGRYKEAVLPLSDAVMKKLASAIMAQMEMKMPRAAMPQISPAAISQIGSSSSMTTQHFNIPAVAGNENIPPDPKIVSALIAQEVRSNGGLQ